MMRFRFQTAAQLALGALSLNRAHAVDFLRRLHDNVYGLTYSILDPLLDHRWIGQI